MKTGLLTLPEEAVGIERLYLVGGKTSPYGCFTAETPVSNTVSSRLWKGFTSRLLQYTS